MAALRRFCARRGTPQEIYSDNSTNYVGAQSEFLQIGRMLRNSGTTISHFTGNHNIKWHFNPPRTPHMGGLWEAAVKAMKRIMQKILQSHILKVDELTSILVEIEAVLNSRPLTPLEATSPDEIVLTPGLFFNRSTHRRPSYSTIYFTVHQHTA